MGGSDETDAAICEKLAIVNDRPKRKRKLKKAA
jgi:hypothetical protein